MPLPENNTAWPPPSNATALGHMAEWSAWYSGDPEQLRGFYQDANNKRAPKTREVQRTNGVAGRLARWWWGTPTADGEAPAKLHVPLAGDICGTSADLLFSEPVNLSSSSDTLNKAMADLQDNGLDAELHQAAEVTAALGGGYLRVVWDKDVRKLPWTDTVHADMAIPTFRWGRLAEVTFWQKLPAKANDQSVYRLLEHHLPGRIEHALFKGKSDNLGTVVPLEDHPDAAFLAKIVDAEGGIPTGTKRLTATYIPNMLPNRLHRGSNQGRSDLQGVTPLLDALDEAYSSWWRDIRHAKSRIHVPAQYLESVDGPGSAGIADIDRELYVPMSGVLADPNQGLAIQAQQFQIRVDDHMKTCQDWTKTIIESAGYSTQSLSGDTGGAVTAAEVYSHERRSYMTRGKKTRYWGAAIRDHLITLVEVANFNLSAGIVPDDSLDVEFQDGVQESALSLSNTAMAMRNAEAASTKTRVTMLHPDWDETAIDDEVALILSENAVASPMGLPGDAGL